MENNERIEAKAALDAIGEARSDLADRLVTPWFYYPTLAVLMTGMVLVYGLDPFRDSPLRILFAFVVILASLALVRVYARTAGVQVGRPAGPRSRVMLAILSVGLVAPLLWLIIDEPAQGVVIGLAVAVFVFTLVAGQAYDAALRADLRAGSE